MFPGHFKISDAKADMKEENLICPQKKFVFSKVKKTDDFKKGYDPDDSEDQKIYFYVKKFLAQESFKKAINITQLFAVHQLVIFIKEQEHAIKEIDGKIDQTNLYNDIPAVLQIFGYPLFFINAVPDCIDEMFSDIPKKD